MIIIYNRVWIFQIYTFRYHPATLQILLLHQPFIKAESPNKFYGENIDDITGKSIPFIDHLYLFSLSENKADIKIVFQKKIILYLSN